MLNLRRLLAARALFPSVLSLSNFHLHISCSSVCFNGYHKLQGSSFHLLKQHNIAITIPTSLLHCGINTHMANADQNEVISGSKLLSVRIQCSGVIVDQLTEALLCFGASSVTVEDASSGEPLGEGISYDPVPWEPQKRQFWSQSCVTALFPAEQDVGECLALAVDSIGLKEIPKYEIIEKEGYDWLQQVQDMFHPVQINDSIWIIPEWRTPPDPLATNIILDPGLAFGTGEHPTTKLCLLFLCESVNGGEHVLDYGTGSGILAIAALKMGAARAVGVDTDPMAVQSMKQNATLNSIGPDKMQVYLVSDDGSNSLSSKAPSEGITEWHLETATSHTIPAQYDIVVANILMNPLLQLAAHITGYVKPGGHVVLSGITIDQEGNVETRVRLISNINKEFDRIPKALRAKKEGGSGELEEDVLMRA